MSTIPTLSNTELHEAIGQTQAMVKGTYHTLRSFGPLSEHLEALLKERQRRAEEHLPIELAR